jgi:AraC family transcriptional regulator
MLQKQLTTVDYREKHSILEILPRAPLLTSHTLAWNGLEVQYHEQPSGEMPEHSTSQHIIAIHHLQKPLMPERFLDGHRRIEQLENEQVVIIPANVLHGAAWHYIAPIPATVLVLDPRYLAHIAYESVNVQKVELLPTWPKYDPIIYQIGSLLQRELKSDGVNCQLYVDGLTTALSAHLLRQYCTIQQTLQNYEGGLPKYKLQRAINYIQAHLTEDISLEDISTELDMSRYYFCRLFKQSTGFSPYQYVIKCRIERSKELLLQGQNSIADVAFQVGFISQSHFSKHFKRMVGVTPKRFLN